MKRPATDPLKAVAYLRCSTERQDLSPEAQRASIEAWAAREGITVFSWHEDRGVSGGTNIEDCPGLLAALENVRTHGAGVLVVAKRDRLHRDTMKAGLLHAMVERGGSRIVSCAGEGNGDEPSDILLRGIIDLFAQHEKLMTRIRTRAALQVKRSRGERTGNCPLGYRSEATGALRIRAGVESRIAVLVADPAEQAAIACARELRASGMSYRAIAAELLARGHAPRVGSRWWPTQVQRMLG